MRLEHSDATKAKALKAFRKAGTITEACRAARIGRRTWYDWIESDEMFARAVMDANEEVTDQLEREAIKRAKEGSDTLIIFLLKSKRPGVYRETQKIELVSPQVRDNLRRTIEILSEELEPAVADRILTRLDLVWQ